LGESLPLRRDLVTIEFRDSSRGGKGTREFWSSDFGPVVHRDSALVFVYRAATNGECRAGEQWLEMIKARSLAEWQGAMRMQARETSNFTYADRAGNIFPLPHPDGGVARALELLVAWDNTAAAESRGALLFETWWNRYRSRLGGVEPFAIGWRMEEPVTTPRGLADAELAVEAFAWAVAETARRFGAWDVAWGDVHRVRRGDVDVPVGGCSGALGCFRVLNFTTDADGKRVVNGGDGWVLAVEFGDEPRAYSVLAYG
jgi:acyl-homoserine lactone acylase PvdQ